MARFQELWSIVLIALVILVKEEGCDAARILGMFPLQGKSHYLMCEKLMRALAARGHQVDVVSHFPLKDPPPNFRDISLAGSLPNLVNNMTFQKVPTFTSAAMKYLLTFAGLDICRLLDKSPIRDIIKNPPNDPPYDLVILELFGADCYLALGRHLKVPIVAIVTNKLFDWMNLPMGNPSNTAIVPSVFSRFSQQMTFTHRLLNTLESGFVKLQWWWYISAQLTFVEKHFGVKVSSISELYKDIAIMLVNTHPSFDFKRPLVPGIVEVGGLHVTDGDQDFSPDVKKWLDDSKDGCVYISFGSMMKIESFPNESIKAFYEAFEHIAPVRVLMKIAKKDELLPGLPKNVMTSPWLPQTRVLQHKNVKLFVTHGGLGSTQEAITYGLPMIVFPIFGDQYLNAHLCSERNMSITLDVRNINAESLTKALKDILTKSSYRENAKRLSKLWTDRPMKAIDTATYWVEYVIRNGNVMSSPASHLSWWQMELLDVYGFIILVLLLILYMTKRLIGLIVCRLFRKSGTQQRTRSSQSSAKSKKNK